MVKIVIGFLFLNVPFVSLGQIGKCILSTNYLAQDQVYAQVDSMPRYPGTEEEFYKFLSTSFDWPNHYSDNETIMVTFVVTEDGKIENLNLKEESKRQDVNEGLLEALERMPKWIPDKCSGTTVKVEYILPIKIGLK